jgi:DNA repair protein RecN (Recombination protein N)
MQSRGCRAGKGFAHGYRLAHTRYNRLCMLLELVVENYAVVERLRVHFHAGLNLLTGETGSGKSIVVDALGLLLGGRASADMIRTGESRARVAGIFDVREGVL